MLFAYSTLLPAPTRLDVEGDQILHPPEGRDRWMHYSRHPDSPWPFPIVLLDSFTDAKIASLGSRGAGELCTAGSRLSLFWLKIHSKQFSSSALVWGLIWYL